MHSSSTLRQARPSLVAVVLVLALAACSGGADAAPVRLSPEPTTGAALDGLVYTRVDGHDLRLDACLPDAADVDSAAAEQGVPAVVVLHGGGFISGSRSTGGSGTVCELVAGAGVAAFSVDYRLAPARYPAPVDDVAAAIEWLRRPAQVARFGIDPTRIALFGSSAGAIIAQTLATRGSGPTDTGSRVKAVVSLSGVSDLRAQAVRLGDPRPDLVQLVLQYLGCDSVSRCPDGADASAISHVDPSDPPMLLVNGADEIVPQQQARAMDAALAREDVPVSLVVVPGSRHGIALLSGTVRQAVQRFLADEL